MASILSKFAINEELVAKNYLKLKMSQPRSFKFYHKIRFKNLASFIHFNCNSHSFTLACFKKSKESQFNFHSKNKLELLSSYLFHTLYCLKCLIIIITCIHKYHITLEKYLHNQRRRDDEKEIFPAFWYF